MFCRRQLELALEVYFEAKCADFVAGDAKYVLVYRWAVVYRWHVIDCTKSHTLISWREALN